MGVYRQGSHPRHIGILFILCVVTKFTASAENCYTLGMHITVLGMWMSWVNSLCAASTNAAAWTAFQICIFRAPSDGYCSVIACPIAYCCSAINHFMVITYYVAKSVQVLLTTHHETGEMYFPMTHCHRNQAWTESTDWVLVQNCKL